MNTHVRGERDEIIHFDRDESEKERYTYRFSRRNQYFLISTLMKSIMESFLSRSVIPNSFFFFFVFSFSLDSFRGKRETFQYPEDISNELMMATTNRLEEQEHDCMIE